MTLTHLSLFSGVGGLDIAAEAAGFTTVGQCEWAEFPRAVLEKHFPGVPKWKDIYDLRADDFKQQTGIERPDIISGGFPCQPHSVAGKRLADGDERDLWGEMRRVISELNPRWVVAENVRGLLSSVGGQFMRNVLRDFAEMGFDVGWCTYPAAWVGAIHRRERVAIVAHANSERLQGWKSTAQPNWDTEQSERIYLPLLRQANQVHLLESAILRASNGVPKRMDRTIALGNAVVPAQFYPIFAAIAEIERMLRAA